MNINPTTKAQYAALIEPLSLWKNNPVIALNEISEGLSNHTFQLITNKKKYIARFDSFNRQIFFRDRGYEYKIHSLASMHKIAPKIIYNNLKNKIQICEFIQGEHLAPHHLESFDYQQKFKNLLTQIYALPFTEKPMINFVDLLEKYFKQLPEGCLYFRRLFRLKQELQPLINKLPYLNFKGCVCHNDLTPGNIWIDKNNNLLALDWEYAAFGNPLFDLAVLKQSWKLEEEFFDKLLINNCPVDISLISIYEKLVLYTNALWHAIRIQVEKDGNSELVIETNLSKLLD